MSEPSPAQVFRALEQMPNRLNTFWEEHGATLVGAALGQSLPILGHLADVELIYGARLRQAKLRDHASWQTLLAQTPTDKHALLARAAIANFIRLRRWNLEHCREQDLVERRADVLIMIAQHDRKRYRQLEQLVTSG